MAAQSLGREDRTLQKAVRSLKAGEQATARHLLEQAVRADPSSKRGWLWLAAAVDSAAERRYCLAQVLSIDRRNALARRELTALGAGAIRSPLDRVVESSASKGRPHSAVLQTVRDHPVPMVVAYLLAITVTEFLTLIIDPRVGLWGHGALLAVLIVHAALIWGRPFHRLVLALAFAPLIRLVSLAMPLAAFPLIYWYLLTSLPLFVTAFLVVHVLGFSRDEIGLQTGDLGVQVLVGLSGLVLGYVEYLLLRPEPLLETLAWGQVVVPALILLISTGLIEELVFRGIMQRAAGECLGSRLGALFVAAIFAMMHMGHSSWLDIPFVFGVSLFFSWIVARTRSILGVTVAHGLTNILLFLVLPTLAGTDLGGWL